MPKKFMLTTADLEDDSQEKIKYVSAGAAIGNDIYFYNDVNNESIALLNKEIADLSKQLLITQITYDLEQTPNIKLHINSDGGEVFGALSAVDRIKASKVPVHSYVEGLVASASTLISVCCHKRYVRKNSIMLVHQIRSWFSGTYENFKDENQNMDVITNIIKKIYLENTKFTDSELTEILKRDIYLDAEECVKYGLADVII